MIILEQGAQKIMSAQKIMKRSIEQREILKRNMEQKNKSWRKGKKIKIST